MIVRMCPPPVDSACSYNGGHNGGKTVVVLGAGASKASDFHLPVMEGFFGARSDRFAKLFDFLKGFYPLGKRAKWNVEELLAFLCISRDRMPLWGMAPRAGADVSYSELYALTLEYITERLTIREKKTCSLHTRLLSQLHPQDTIITLNYDLVVDEVLRKNEPRERNQPRSDSRIWKSGRLIAEGSVGGGVEPPSLTPREEKTGFYLKLHGSLDWLRCPTSGCRNHINIFFPPFHGFEEGQRPGRPCRFCGAALETMIVPPIVAKRLEDRGRMAFLWNVALRELRRATRVVFIGISLAPTDFELQWLIREGIGFAANKPIEIEVVNPKRTHRKRLLSLIPCCPSTVRQYDWVDDYLTEYGLRDQSAI